MGQRRRVPPAMALGYGLAMSIFRQRTLIKGFLLGCIPVLAALALAGGEPRGAHVGRGANSSILVIETATAWHEFSVEIARSPVDQARGLMFRRRLRTDSGMLFIYSRDQQITMWMKKHSDSPGYAVHRPRWPYRQHRRTGDSDVVAFDPFERPRPRRPRGQWRHRLKAQDLCRGQGRASGISAV